MSEPDYTVNLLRPAGTKLDWAAGRKILEELTPERHLVLETLAMMCSPWLCPPGKQTDVTLDELVQSVEVEEEPMLSKKDVLKFWGKLQEVVEALDKDVVPKKLPGILRGYSGDPYKEEKGTASIYVFPQNPSSDEVLSLYHASGALAAAGFDAPLSLEFTKLAESAIERARSGPEI